MSNDLSVDCEGLGTAYDSPLISIGARFFDKTTGKLFQSFYVEIALNSLGNQWQRNFRVDPDTVRWWIMQSDRAKKVFEKPDSEKKTVATALLELNHWIIKESRSGPIAVWCNGPSQDATWIEHAYTVGGHGLALPWKYDRPRDMRTITDLATELVGWNWKTVKAVGTSHNAVDDADYQANCISSAFAAMRAGLKTTPKAIPYTDDEDDL